MINDNDRKPTKNILPFIGEKIIFGKNKMKKHSLFLKILPKSPKKSPSSCSHSNAMKYFRKHVANNFYLHTLKKNKTKKYIECNGKMLLEEGVLIIVISDKEEEETNES